MKLILQGKGHTCISPDGSNTLTWRPSQKIRPKGAPDIQSGDEPTKTPGGRNSNTDLVGSKDFQKAPPSAASTLQPPTWGQIKTLTNQVKNLVSQQEMPQSPENLLIAMLAPLACVTPARAGLTN